MVLIGIDPYPYHVHIPLGVQKKLRQSSGLPLKQLLIEVHQVTDTNSSQLFGPKIVELLLVLYETASIRRKNMEEKMNNV